MQTTNNDSEAGDFSYLRNREPDFFYRAAQRSWFDRKTESDEEYLIASFASELTNVLSDESLQLLGESGMYPLAKSLYEDISPSELEEAFERAVEADAGDAPRIQVLNRIAYQLAIFIEPEQIEAALEDRLSADSSIFDNFDEDTKEQLVKATHEHARTRLDDMSLIRDGWLTIHNARIHHQDDFLSQQNDITTSERSAVEREKDTVTIRAPT